MIHKIYVDGGSCYSSITFYDELVVVATLGGTIAAVNMVPLILCYHDYSISLGNWRCGVEIQL